ncbi:MAG TPA: MarR family winged helix-turn-helix transcriptional regulator [Hyphomonas sp.]|nr:MarR family winged helix-turn-helix transcriptional regulator [Hyphomonas sp.]HPF24585.1 MarR family winged helix-turn-helix transcriptional regulator [Hyphomonas sp.]
MTARSSRFYHALQIAAHRLQKRADQALMEAAGISTAQSAVLAIVAGNPGMRQNQVAALLGLNESAVTAMVARLVKLGLLARARSSEDSRAWELSVTPEGEAALKAIEAPFAGVNALIDEALGPETDALAARLHALSARLATG